MKNPSWSFPNSKFKLGLSSTEASIEHSIPIGGSQSYGDANFSSKGKSVREKSKFMEFDASKSILEVSSSISIKEVLNFLLNHSSTLPVVPGTANATIGGCVASDVHGKNSYHMKTFANSVSEILLDNGIETKWINRNHESEWQSTIGGQGLSGMILRVRIQTIPLNTTQLESMKFLTNGIRENLELLLKLVEDYQFAVSWIDGRRKKNDRFGYVEVADEISTGERPKSIENINLISSSFPKMKVINKASINVFSRLTRLNATRNASAKRVISRWDYLFPNMNIGRWNHLFGNSGFHEIQFLCPKHRIDFAERLISKICDEKPVFLIGIKVLNHPSEGHLSFSGQGFSIAINFAADKTSESYVQEIYSKIIHSINSRIYLTKDWVLQPEQFRAMYPQYIFLQEHRKSSGLYSRVKSSFSDRIQLDL